MTSILWRLKLSDSLTEESKKIQSIYFPKGTRRSDNRSIFMTTVLHKKCKSPSIKLIQNLVSTGPI